jgi:hypothetical protein
VRRARAERPFASTIPCGRSTASVSKRAMPLAIATLTLALSTFTVSTREAPTSATSCACIVAGSNPRPRAEPTAVIDVDGILGDCARSVELAGVEVEVVAGLLAREIHRAAHIDVAAAGERHLG